MASKRNQAGGKPAPKQTPKPGLPTQRMLAKNLGLSRTTVAEILGGKATHRYNDETCKRVLEAAKLINYRPHRSAQAMRRGRSNLIGVIHFGGAYEVSRQMRYYLIQGIRAAGYDAAVMESTPQDRIGNRPVDQLLEARVEGVIISNTIESFGVEDVEILKAAGVPVVTLAGQEKWGIPAVFEDIRGAMRRLVRHVCGVGHRKLMLLTNQYDSRASLTRIQGFADGIAECGGALQEGAKGSPGPREFGASTAIEGSVVRIVADRGAFDLAEPAYHFMQRLIAQGTLPDVILCHNDQWARGVFAAAYERGLRVPEDIALTGFDNESFGAYPPFEFTTVGAPTTSEAEKTVELLVDSIRGISVPQQILFPCELVLRRSCGATTRVPS